MNPLLIVVSGPSGSGKTTFSQNVSTRFQLPLIAKDSIKEVLFHKLGWKDGIPDRSWSSELTRASYGFLYERSSQLLKRGISHIIEANFKPEYTVQPFRRLQESCQFRCLRIHFDGDPDVLFSRYKERASGRSQVHLDMLESSQSALYDQLRRRIFSNPGIESEVIPIDTTEWNKINYEELYARIEEKLHPAGVY